MSALPRPIRRARAVKAEPAADDNPPDPAGGGGDTLIGHKLVGREINLLWTDGKRYDAVVVRYYQRDDEYKLVYLADEGVEVTSIRYRQWRLKPKRRSNYPVLVGSIIEFRYPIDGQRYQAMIYSHSEKGDHLKICYLEDHSTDYIGGQGWDFMTNSPCDGNATGGTGRDVKQEEGGEDGEDNDGDDDDDKDGDGDGDYEGEDEGSEGETVQAGGVRRAGRRAKVWRVSPGAVQGDVKMEGRSVVQGRVSKRKPWMK